LLKKEPRHAQGTENFNNVLLTSNQIEVSKQNVPPIAAFLYKILPSGRFSIQTEMAFEPIANVIGQTSPA
jgi:hypothetical protein